jgi:predicted nucleic acid-binding protein
VNLVVDASVALSWHISRSDPNEAGIAQQAIHAVMSKSASVPPLWFPEVTNALLTAERRQVSDPRSSARFLADLEALPIVIDNRALVPLRSEILQLGRLHNLSAYDATYLELALHTNASLATFDRKLADAFRKAGGNVFGDLP